MNARQVVERLFEAESHGDVEGIVDMMHENVILSLTCRRLYAPDATTLFRGKDEVRRVYAEDVKTRGTAFRIEAEQVIEQGDHIAAIWVAHRGMQRGLVRRGVDVFKISDGLIEQGTVYLDLTTVPELHG